MIPKINDVAPTGTQVLVELLNEEELLGTTLVVALDKNKKVKETPQAYVLAVGPMVRASDYGFDVGDRVMFSTPEFVAIPNYNKYHRDRGTLPPHAIRAVLKEEKAK